MGLYWLSLIVIFGALACLLRAAFVLTDDRQRLPQQWLWAWTPISLHAGWLSLAAFLNIAQVIVAYRLLSTTDMLRWSLILFAVLAIVLLWANPRMRGNADYAGAATWGLIGVYVMQSAWGVRGAVTAAWCALVLIVALVGQTVWLRLSIAADGWPTRPITRSPQRHCKTAGMPASRDLIVLRPEGLYCPAGDFHIDPWRPVPRAVITHGHGDHARGGMGDTTPRAPALPILRWRLGGAALPRATSTAKPFALGDARVSLPSGRARAGLGAGADRSRRRIWVASGDYKRQPDPTCAPFEVVPCDTFITEATFGLPVYRWPETSEVAREIVEWREECAARGEAAVLFCYALGKAQRVLAELMAHTDRPAWLHGAIAAGVQVYREAACALLDTRPVSDEQRGADFAGELVLAPPSAAGSRVDAALPRARRRGSPRAGCACAATGGGATTTAASWSPTTPIGPTCCAPFARPARAA